MRRKKIESQKIFISSFSKLNNDSISLDEYEEIKLYIIDMYFEIGRVFVFNEIKLSSKIFILSEIKKYVAIK